MNRGELSAEMIPDDVKERLTKANVNPDQVDWYAGRTREFGFSEIPKPERDRLLQEARQRRRENAGPVRRLFHR